MAIDAEEVQGLVNAELSKITERELLDFISPFLVKPRCELRDWDYGTPGQQFPCWIVIAHPQSNTAIAYCDQGFGPLCPWGLLSMSEPHSSMGMDSGWFSTFEDAVRDSWIWQERSTPS